MKQNKEVFTQVGAHVFRAMASLLDAAHTFYEGGYPDEGDTVTEAASKMLNALPENSE